MLGPLLDEVDLKVLLSLENGIPLTAKPFSDVATRLGVTEEEIIERLRKLQASSVIRRFGASIKHRRVGITANAMVVWRVPERRVREVGGYMSGFKEVTHCYERKVIPGKWTYNLYTVIHAYERESIERFVKRLSEAVGINDYLVLFSIREFKKASAPLISMIISSGDRHPNYADPTDWRQRAEH